MAICQLTDLGKKVHNFLLQLPIASVEGATNKKGGFLWADLLNRWICMEV